MLRPHRRRTAVLSALLILATSPSAMSQVTGNASPPGDIVGDTAPSAVSAPGFGDLVSKLNPANWKMPTLRMPKVADVMPGSDEKDRIIQKKDGLLSEVGKTASSSWKKTKDALNPMNVLPASSRSPAGGEEKPGFFKRLFSPPASAGTESSGSDVNSFLRGQRPGM